MKKLTISLVLAAMVGVSAMAQTQNYTREEVLSMSVEQLSDLPLEDLMQAVETLGVSSVDELFAMIMNKTVSSASKNEESAFTSPLASTMITRAEILQWGCNSIEEALRLVPGVMVSQKTNGNFDIQMRGLNNIVDGQRLLYTENYNTKLLLDGRDLTDYVTGALLMEFLPIGIEDVKCIEVVRGPASSLYGQNAITGVINIITEKPAEHPEYMTGGTIQTSFDNGTTIASAATRLRFNDFVAGGASVNIETRDRSTKQVYVPGTKADYWYSPYFGNYSDESLAEPVRFEGGWMDLEDADCLRAKNDAGGFDRVTYKHYTVEDLIPDPQLGKKHLAVNGYLNFMFNPQANIDVTAGYNKTHVNTTTLEECVFSLGGRKNEGGYINLNGKFGDLSLILNYDHRTADYCVGTPGYQAIVARGSAIVDYTWNLLDGRMQVRPIFEYNSYNATDEHGAHDETINGKVYHIPSFFGGWVNTSTFAPSVKVDYRTEGGWKFTGAGRLDITTNPAHENLSWQLQVNKQLNKDNFFRFSYGRATRAAVLTNTSVNYLVDRSDLSMPKDITLKGSTHDLMYLDGFELGYRVRPTSSILLDAELFYSISKDYGSLKAYDSYLTTSAEKFTNWMYGSLNALMGNQDPNITNEQILGAYIMNNWNKTYDTHSIFKYDNVQFKAKQIGASVNMDWIITTKLIAKMNMNWQQTKVDNYYTYSQSESIKTQIANCVNNTTVAPGEANKSVAGFTAQIVTAAIKYATINAMKGGYDKSDPRFMGDIVAYGTYLAKAPSGLATKYGSKFDKTSYDDLHSAFEGGRENYSGSVNGVAIAYDELLAAYYALKYDIVINPETKNFEISNSVQPSRKLENNHKHKSTPSFYGTVGLIFKPVSVLNVSALMSFMSSREFLTSYGYAKQSATRNLNLKVGWTPNKNVEFFIQGHNLLGGSKTEFIYGDPVKSMFTTGMSCRF